MKNDQLLHASVASPRVIVYIATVATATFGADVARSLAGLNGLIFFGISGSIIFSLGYLTRKVNS